MPRAVDRYTPKVEHDPTQDGSEFHIQMQKRLEEMWSHVFEQVIQNSAQVAIDFLKDLTGLDFSSVDMLLLSLAQKVIEGGEFVEALVAAIWNAAKNIDDLPIIGDILDFLKALILDSEPAGFPYTFPFTLGGGGASNPVARFFANLRWFFEAIDFSDLEFNPVAAWNAFISNTPLADVFSGLENLVSSVQEALEEAIGDAVEALQSVIQQILNKSWDAIFGDDEGLIDRTADDLAEALKNIPAINVIGVGAANMVDTITDILDNFWRGLTRLSGSGKSIADVANAAMETTTRADTAMEIGEWNNAVLGLRNNKSLMEGVDETEEANFTLEKLWGVGSDPVAAYAASSSSFPVAYWRATEDSVKGFISWFGRGVTDVSAIYLDVYKANYEDETWELIYTSPDVSGAASGSWQYLIHHIDEEDRFQVVSGDVLGVAWRVVGTGTHSIAGIPIAGMPEHPTIHPKKPVSARSGSGDLAFSSTSYSANTVPWFGMGIAAGDIPIPYFAPRKTAYSGAGTYTYTIPASATHLDVVLLGAGGGGHGGNPIVPTAPGEGGDAGSWSAETLVRGVDFPVDATSLTIVVGGGGSAGPWNSPGGTGGSTRRQAISGGKAQTTAAGGAGGSSQNPALSGGDSPGNYTYNGVTYIGGGGAASPPFSNGAKGSAPGGGGGGGAGGTWGVAWTGGAGADGAAWITARQNS